MRRGHSVSIATSDMYREKVEYFGLNFVAIRPSSEDLGGFADWVEKVLNPKNGAEFLIRHVLTPHVESNLQAMQAEASISDVLISHSLTFAMPVLARSLNKPWASVVLQPNALFSIHSRLVLPQFPWLTKIYPLIPLAMRRLLFRAIQKKVSHWVEPVMSLRSNLLRENPVLHPLFEGQFSPHLNLALFSPHFAQAQPDWPKNLVITGFPLFDINRDSEPSVEFRRFIAEKNRRAPIIFTLGSFSVDHAGDFYRAAARAAIRLGKRAVLLTGNDPRNRAGVPDHPDILMSSYEPFSKCFPHSCLIVHQGGIGTVSHALHSGKPQLIFPMTNDQPDNAFRAVQLQVALSMDQKLLTASRMEQQIDKVLTNPDIARRALNLQTKISAEAGVREAVDQLEQLA